MVRTEGCSRAPTSFAMVRIGGGEGHASQVESVSNGKGWVTGGAHTQLCMVPDFKSRKSGFALPRPQLPHL